MNAYKISQPLKKNFVLHGKMYAYIGIDDRNGRPIITLKLEPMFSDMLRQEHVDRAGLLHEQTALVYGIP